MEESGSPHARVISPDGGMRAALEEYCRESGVRYAALVDHTGGVACFQHGDGGLHDHGEAAVLAAGVYAALRALGDRLGAGTFGEIHAPGSRFGILIFPAGSDFLLLSVLDAAVNVDDVKKTAAPMIRSLARPIPDPPAPVEGESGSAAPLSESQPLPGVISGAIFRERP